MGLRILDVLLTLVHFIIIGFNLFGWIWKPARRLHLIVVAVTASCWFLLGIWFGIGYCPVTDLQWHIKEKLGETNLPGSFIKYYADKITGRPVDAGLIDILTTACFFAAALLSVFLNFFAKRKTGSSAAA